jgi:hypothetical protein
LGFGWALVGFWLEIGFWLSERFEAEVLRGSEQSLAILGYSWLFLAVVVEVD